MRMISLKSKRDEEKYSTVSSHLHTEQKGLGVCVSRCLCDFTRSDLKEDRVVLESDYRALTSLLCQMVLGASL